MRLTFVSSQRSAPIHYFGFVSERQITEASLIANELIEEWSFKKKAGVVTKLDLEKVFEVDCNYLDSVLKAKGFGDRWRNWISGCVSSANYSIIINGKP